MWTMPVPAVPGGQGHSPQAAHQMNCAFRGLGTIVTDFLTTPRCHVHATQATA